MAEVAVDPSALSKDLLSFFADRLKVYLKDKGAGHDLIDAVFSLGGQDDLALIVKRVEALDEFLKSDDGTNLLAGVKRASNILSIEEKKDKASYAGTYDLKLLVEKEELALAAAIEEVKQDTVAAINVENFKGAMNALAELRAPVDAFFDKVTVNDPNAELRINRLKLLSEIRAATTYRRRLLQNRRLAVFGSSGGRLSPDPAVRPQALSAAGSGSCSSSCASHRSSSRGRDREGQAGARIRRALGSCTCRGCAPRPSAHRSCRPSRCRREPVAERDSRERPRLRMLLERVLGLGAILGEERLHHAVLDHHGVVEHGHVRHAAVGVARIDVIAEQAELLGCRHGRDAPADEILVAGKRAPHGFVGFKLIDEDTYRDTRLAALAIGHVGDVLAAAETALEQVVDEGERLVVREMREELSLEPARQIGTRLRGRDVEFRKVFLLFRHSTTLPVAADGLRGRLSPEVDKSKTQLTAEILLRKRRDSQD